jgi:two-component system NtrC family sensor kinase
MDLFVPEELREGYRSDLLARFTGQSPTGERGERFRGSDGRERRVLWRDAPLPGDQDRPTTLIRVGFDVTDLGENDRRQKALQRQAHAERERAEAALSELRMAREQLTRSERLRSVGEMVAGILHELSHPMTGVLGFAEMARSCVESEERRRECLDRTISEAERARGILHTMLALSREDEPSREPVDLNQVLRDVLDLQTLALRLEKIDVCTDLEPRLLPVHGDASSLHQVVVNLFANARQALAGSPEARSLAVRTRNESGRVRLEVEDSGPGIPADRRGRLFEPFYTTKPEGKGTGLGLSVSRGIVRRHGGELRFREGRLGGACFVVELPVAAVDAAAEAPGRGRTEPRRVPVAERLSVPGGEGRILAVDDEDSVLEILNLSLSRVGFHVDRARDGQEALRFLDRHRYDAVVSDVRMPGMGGPELFDAVSQRWPHMLPRLLFLTGDVINQTSQRFLDRCGCEHLEKPFVIDELVAAVQRIAAPTDEGVSACARA